MAGMKSFVGLSGPKFLKGPGLEGCSAWHKESHDRCYCQPSGAVSRLGQGAKMDALGKCSVLPDTSIFCVPRAAFLCLF